jgi:DNA invertase Pin-like site-specific DNA recombinase
MAKQKDRKVGIYVRLSKEDARAGESVSIENQKLLLTKHVKDNGWELVEIYCDDGFSGTNQNRPAMQRMFQDIKQRHINTVLIKDLSRLGRNYLEVGNLAEVFLPEHGCELISLNEKVDEMMVFRNWFNEQHSRETSKKVRAVKRMCAQNGKFIGAYAPYGYQKSDANKHLLVPDETAAVTVRKIYELRSQGLGHKAIANQLNNAGLIPPRDYYYQQRNEKNPHRTSRSWTCITVREILDNEVYIGNMVQGKYGSASYKNHKLIDKPEDEWIRVEGTHEPLVSIELWEMARSLAGRNYHPKKRKDGTVSIFCGTLYCADCGFKMRSSTQKRERKDGSLYVHSNFQCGTYSRSGKPACTPHIIGENILQKLVAEQIRIHAMMVECDEARMIERILRLQNDETVSNRAAYMSELQNHKSRLVMLGNLIEKLYEDRLTGTVPETAFKNLIQKYEQERLDRQQAASNLENRIQSIRQNEDGASLWADMIRRCTQLETLDAQTFLLLVDRIEIGDATEISGVKARDVKVIYKYVGDLSWLEQPAEYPEGRASHEQAV